MYVIGTSEIDFISMRTIPIMDCFRIYDEINKIIYECNLNKATTFPDYETAIKIINEIKDRKDEIWFENDSIIGNILDRGNKFNVENLKVYQLVVTECSI